MNAVVFGPGRIGCGFVGQLLGAAGWSLTFVGRGAVVAHLERVGRYRVHLTDGRAAQDVEVDGVHALATTDVEGVTEAIAAADLVAVSVGAGNLAAVAPLLAAGLARRTTPVNVIAFENCADPAGCLRAAVLRREPGLAAAGHGFSGALVSRIVTRREGDPARDAPLAFIGDPAEEFVVHGPSLVAPLPALPGLRAVDDYGAWVTKKLYTFSAGHAAAAYLGALKGYQYVHAAIRDPEIRRAVLAAMEEGRRGLMRRYGAALAGTRAELERIVSRFENAALGDPVLRVGRDPLRKLRREDRLVGAALLAREAGVAPRRLALVAAAALCFDCAGGAGGRAGAADATLRTVAGLDPRRGLGLEVATAFTRLAAGRERDNVLLSLRQLVWSWARPATDAEPLALPLRRSA
jgi:mannitol-1-phosphate 5-dehydrogenase